MSVQAVIGLQWGDEAKGKMVDLLAADARVVARYNGGDNAGHTVINPYGTFKLRLIPNGMSAPGTICVLGPGVVVNLATLLSEVENIQSHGLDLSGRLWVSPRCHIVMPYHPLLEGIYEQAKGQGRTGTTGRGMGPVYADKVSYNGLRLFDLADAQIFAEKLRIQLAIKNPILQAFGRETLDFQQVFDEKMAQYEQVRPFVHEPFGLLQETLAHDGQILLEGAQASLLDNDWGTYPFCTASNTLAGGAAAGLGLAPRWIQHVIGVAKAYTTRVGGGPMPTELLDADGELLRQEGAEFGTVTGRPRRCGWFDAEAVRFTAQLNGVSEIALTKLDVLDKFARIKICVGYERSAGAGPAHYWEGDAHWLDSCQPVYMEMEGWQQSTRSLSDFAALPPQARAYVRKIEELVSVPIGYVATGPGRDEIIRLR